jgi:uncharacterized surface protein with fasciclin (FAS1) repeats/plastocyanin
MHTRSMVLGVAFLVMAGLVCFAASAQPQEETTVVIQNLSFEPATVEVFMGSTVVWTNEDDVEHTVTSTEPLFDSDVIPPGGEFTYEFDEEGIYDYICTIHPEMRGQVQVIEPEEGMVPDNETIPDVISLNDNLTELNTALAAANLTEALAAPGPFTVFAPTDEAFAAVPADVMAALGNDTALLADVLTYHVVEGEYLAADLMDGMNLTTLQGGELLITIGEAENVTDMNVTETEEIVTEENETDMNVTETEETVMEENVTATVMVNEATVVEADIMASNGVIHVIDAVLVPADLVLPANETANETATEEIVLEVTGEAAEEMTEAPAAT